MPFGDEPSAAKAVPAKIIARQATIAVLFFISIVILVISLRGPGPSDVKMLPSPGCQAALRLSQRDERRVAGLLRNYEFIIEWLPLKGRAPELIISDARNVFELPAEWFSADPP